MLNFEKNKKIFFYLCLAAIFILALVFRVSKFSDKKELFIDEYFSIILASCNKLGIIEFVSNDSTIFKGQELIRQYFAKDYGFESTLADLRQLRVDIHDSSHPNLYYALLRLSFLNAGDNLPNLINRGLYLNLCLFFLSFVILYRFSSFLFTNKLLVLCTLFIAFLNPGAIANTLFLREYQLQETTLLLFTYVFSRYCLKVIKNEAVGSWCDMLALSISAALILLSGYLSGIYVFTLGCFFIFLCFKYKQTKKIVFFIFSMLLSLVFCLVTYQKFFSVLSAGKSSGLDIFSIHNISVSFSSLLNVMNEYFISIPTLCLVIILIIIIIFHSKRTVVKNAFSDAKAIILLFILFAALLWGIIVFGVTYFKAVRYIAPVLPILSLLIPFLLSFFKAKVQIIYTFLFSCLVLYQTITIGQRIYWGYIPVDSGYIKEANTPLIVAGVEGWKQTYLLPYYTNGRSVRFAFDSTHLRTEVQQYKTVYAVMPKDSVRELLFPFDTYYIERSFTIDGCYLVGLELKRIN